jgi:hypothetical protein
MALIFTEGADGIKRETDFDNCGNYQLALQYANTAVKNLKMAKQLLYIIIDQISFLRLITCLNVVIVCMHQQQIGHLYQNFKEVTKKPITRSLISLLEMWGGGDGKRLCHRKTNNYLG